MRAGTNVGRTKLITNYDLRLPNGTLILFVSKVFLIANCMEDSSGIGFNVACD